MTASIDREQFRKIVAEQLQVDLEKVVDSARFTDDLEADSLDLVELIMAFEENYHTEISDEDAEKIATVGEAWEYLQLRAAAVEA
jgi:acyl carrier protein